MKKISGYYLLLSLLFFCFFSRCECDPRSPAKPRKGEVQLGEQLAESEKKSKELENKVDNARLRYEKNKNDPQATAELQKCVHDITNPIITKKEEIKAKLEEAKKDPKKTVETLEYFSTMANDLDILENKIPSDLKIEIEGKEQTKGEFMEKYKDDIKRVRDARKQMEEHNLKELSLLL